MTARQTVGLTVTLIGVLTCSVHANINTNGQLGLVRTLSAKTFGQTSLNVGIGANYAQSKNFLTWVAYPGDEYSGLTEAELNAALADEPTRLFSGNFFAALGLTTFWDVAVSAPMYWDGSGRISDLGMGDVEFSTKLLYPRPGKPRVFYQSYFINVAADFAQFSEKGVYPRHMYYYTYDGKETMYGAKQFAVKAMLLWTFDFTSLTNRPPFRIDVNLGAAFPDGRKAITALANLALEYTPVEVVTFFVDAAAEVRGKTIGEDFAGIPGKEMIFVTPGVKINSPMGVYLHIAVDLGISGLLEGTKSPEPVDNPHPEYKYATTTTPPIGIQFGFGWSGYLAAQDMDKDGIKDDDDRCPKDPEDIDGFEDNDGCPDLDNDKDGIPDVKDKCPDKAEDIDGFEDTDGCPDEDNDGDGIVDIKDQCPNVAEDFDGVEDKDGCPDYDNDKDGIPDSLDKCPNDIEDFDKFMDDDGCPDVDNDKDGIPDLKDKCPNEPETFNSFEDEDGCPDEKPVKKEESVMPRQQTLTGVVFKSGRSDIDPVSFRYLDPIADEMKKFPEIEIEIRGHTDAVGNYNTNMSLSQLRAEAIRQYIIARGIGPARIRSVGFGSSSPIADNRTAAGRTQNRRIEVLRIK